MYSRELDGEERSFGVSGKLWHGVLVMYDRETDSLWTQLEGRAIRGSETGRHLSHYPSVFTTWEAWKAAHPDTLVLEKPAEESRQTESHYGDYFDDPGRLFLPELGEGLGDRVAPKELVFGMVVHDEALAVTARLIEETGVVNAVVAGEPIAFVWEPSTSSVRGVKRRRGDTILVLEGDAAGLAVGSVRDVANGGLLSLGDLEGIRVDRAFWYAWARSHEGSEVLAE